MVNTLPPKPGISSGKITHIPDTLDKHWFRRFVTNYLEAADVRNAVSGPGISITGHFPEPATISVTGGTVLATATVATLPTSPKAGTLYTVSDALGPAYGATVVGGGSVFTMVMFDGTNWTCR